MLGANVVLNARSAGALEEVAQTIRGAGGHVLAIPGDVSHLEDCRTLIQQTVDHFGSIDALVNNAGIIDPIAPIAEADPTL
jgi:NAD(P)-dependent dehydrogenase (short-subunit alcohol dehydrogenase family)